MPSFFLDGQEVAFEPGEDILTAAQRAGIFVPHYCYHEGLSRAATCRMCLVDIEDAGNGRAMPKLQTSCSTPAAENMKVVTKNDKVKTAREQVMEFLLINHPLDCSICDQAGECTLQEFSFKYGTGKSAFDFEKRIYGLREIGTFLELERNRCIHCTRCVRFSQEITGTSEMGVYGRNHQLTVDTFIDNPLTDLFQGNLADICPVGAITLKDFRFRKRVWKLRKTKSICAGCATGCNIDVHTHKGQVHRFTPRENQEVNRWWMCDPGRISFRDLVNPEKRQLKNVFRGVECTPAQAIEQIAAALQGSVDAQKAEIGQRKTIFYASPHSTLEELEALKKCAQACFEQAICAAPAPPVDAQAPPVDAQGKGGGIDGIDNDKFYIYNLISPDKSPNSRGLQLLEFTLCSPESIAEMLAAGDCNLFVVGEPRDDADLQALFAQASFSVHLSLKPSAVVNAADAVLAVQSHLEKTGVFVNRQGLQQTNRAAIMPLEGTQNEVQIFTKLRELLVAKQELPFSA